jgi:hypothetical protein
MRTTMLRAESKLAALETEATSTGLIDEGNG